jgi:DNA polymerase-1
MAKTKEKLMIIDGNALIHRSFHALPPTMTTKDGEMVNAVYGFATVLLKAIRELKPEYVVLTLDKKGPTFRHKKYKDYKATRVKAPDELYMQIPKVKELTRAFNIPIFEQTGYEADDLIGTIVNQTDGKIEKIIVTGDLDALQLINDHTKVYKLGRGLADGLVHDRKMTKAHYDLFPEQVIDYKAICGDASDNIPGVRGIGDIGAKKLLSDFKTLENIYKNIESKKIKERTRNLLKEHKREALLSKELATIKTNVRIDFDLEKTRFKDLNEETVIKALSDLEFKSLLPRVQTLFSQVLQDSKEEKEEKVKNKFERNKNSFKYKLIEREKQFKAFLTKLKQQKQFAFDTETSSFDPLTAELLGISFAWKKGEAYYLKIKNEDLRIEEDNLFNYKKSKSKIKNQKSEISHPWLVKLQPVFANKQVKKYGHNIKFDIRVMRSNGITVENIAFDTMVASYLLNPGTRQHNLDAVTFSELGFEKISKNDLLGKGRERVGFADLEDERLMLYSCEDADFTYRLVNKLNKQLREQQLTSLFNKIEMPLVNVLAVLEDNGVKLNEKILANMSQKLTRKLKQIEKKVYAQAGTKFNINSTQQLREVLYEKLEIPTETVRKTKTGLSTAADELHKLRDLHPIIKLIQEHRELMKLLTTYINALPKLVNKKTKRLHTSFNQTITATGRLSSTEPNLQNIPIRTELGREIRNAFVASRGQRLISLDYSQIELRLAAHMSGDEKMIKAFKAGADIHTATAAEIHQVNPETVTKEMRREAKAINFGILYGQGPHGLSQTADIPYWRAKEFIDQYFIVYKNIKKFIDKTIKSAHNQGYVETLFNRRRYLPEINSSVVMVRKAAERMAINTPLQGTAADMIKVAMIEIDNKMTQDPKVKMILQVHDELVFEVTTNEAEKNAKKIKEIMEKVIKLKVPVVVDVSIGSNWGEMAILDF